MFDKVLTFLFGSQNERDVKALKPIVEKVEAKESWAKAFKDEALKEVPIEKAMKPRATCDTHPNLEIYWAIVPFFIPS